MEFEIFVRFIFSIKILYKCQYIDNSSKKIYRVARKDLYGVWDLTLKLEFHADPALLKYETLSDPYGRLRIFDIPGIHILR